VQAAWTVEAIRLRSGLMSSGSRRSAVVHPSSGLLVRSQSLWWGSSGSPARSSSVTEVPVDCEWIARPDRRARKEGRRMDTQTSASPPLETGPSTDLGATSWRPVELESYADGKIAPPEYLPRDDGVHLVYRGKAHSFIGESESLKTWAALAVVRDFMRRGETVLYLDFESDPLSMMARLRGIGVNPLGGGFVYVRPDEPLRGRAAADFAEAGEYFRPSLVVIDGVTEFMAIHRWDINDAADTANAQNLILRRWPGAMTTLQVDHVAKGGGTALGSQHKRAGIDGASYRFEPKTSAGVGGVSVAKVYVAKDREGLVLPNVRQPSRFLGEFRLDSSVEPWRVEIVSPEAIEELAAQTRRERAEDLFERALAFIRTGPVHTTAVREALGIGRDAARELVGKMEQGGHIRRQDGPQPERQPWIAV
jgi:hypothetical protein